jgi:aminoglycoside/choline kinase family phosphotransferase
LDALGDARSFVHRDYHADNLLWLPARTGVARVGVLDFQDAMAGPLEYDLASLLHDARRVVSEPTITVARERWQTRTGRSASEVAKGFAVCSVQRGLRILGVFTRLCIRDGKTHYPDFIPRTWDLLLKDLAHPDLAELKALVTQVLPPPTPERLASIRARADQGAP